MSEEPPLWASFTTGAAVGVDTHYEVVCFLNLEAELLDRHRYPEWLKLMSEDIRYRMPVQVTTQADVSGEVLGGMAHFDEDAHSLSKRVQRLMGGHAWTENPPSRTRRYVTNVRCSKGGSEDELVVRSYVLLFRSRLDVRAAEWVSVERDDTLRRVDGALRLADRLITVDEAVLRTQNLAVFL